MVKRNPNQLKANTPPKDLTPSEIMEKYNINENQMAFVDEYIACGHAGQAYMTVYQPKNMNVAKRQASVALKKVNIKAYWDARMAEKNKKKIASGDEVLATLTKILRGETEEEVVFCSPDGSILKTSKKPAIKDRIKAGELIGKRYGMWVDRTKVDMKSTKPIQISVKPMSDKPKDE